MRPLRSLPWLALCTAAGLSPTPAEAMASLGTGADLAPAPPPPPRDLHLRFYLEPEDYGARTLVLKDDDDLRLPMGRVEPTWACEAAITQSDYDGDKTMEVACGGGAVRAFLNLDIEKVRIPGDEGHVVRYGRLTAGASRGTSYEIPRDRNGKLWMDTQIVDPAASSCENRVDEPLDVALEIVSPRRSDRDDPVRELQVSSRPVSVGSVIKAYEGEVCKVLRDDGGTEMVASCGYLDQPHEELVDLRVRDGALLWTYIDRSICSGYSVVYGGWRLGCNSTVRWPHADRTLTEENVSLPQAPSDAEDAYYAQVEY